MARKRNNGLLVHVDQVGDGAFIITLRWRSIPNHSREFVVRPDGGCHRRDTGREATVKFVHRPITVEAARLLGEMIAMDPANLY